MSKQNADCAENINHWNVTPVASVIQKTKAEKNLFILSSTGWCAYNTIWKKV